MSEWVMAGLRARLLPGGVVKKAIPIVGLVWVLGALALTGCTWLETYRVRETEEKMVANCAYIDTVTAFSDMGPFQIHPILTDDARDKVLRRAENLNATHVVWVGDYYFGGAAMAYYCWE